MDPKELDCCSCEQKIGEKGSTLVSGDTVRCTPCNNLKQRMHRLFQKRQDLQKDFRSRSDEDRIQFYANHSDKFGPDLAKEVTLFIESTEIDTTSSKVAVGGDFKDIEDLKRKYEGKPEQLSSLLKCQGRLRIRRESAKCGKMWM